MNTTTTPSAAPIALQPGEGDARWFLGALGTIKAAAETTNGRLAVLGQRKWAVQGGFPHLCHGGLSLLEAVVPFIEFAAK